MLCGLPTIRPECLTKAALQQADPVVLERRHLRDVLAEQLIDVAAFSSVKNTFSLVQRPIVNGKSYSIPADLKRPPSV